MRCDVPVAEVYYYSLNFATSLLNLTTGKPMDWPIGYSEMCHIEEKGDFHCFIYRIGMYIKKICRSFFWHGSKYAKSGHCLVAWQQVCQPLNMGGLGIHNIKFPNNALRMRWRWLEREGPVVLGKVYTTIQSPY
jgi:hypothetical protein